jgi:hypothetical protein
MAAADRTIGAEVVQTRVADQAVRRNIRADDHGNLFLGPSGDLIWSFEGN